MVKAEVVQASAFAQPLGTREMMNRTTAVPLVLDQDGRIMWLLVKRAERIPQRLQGSKFKMQLADLFH
jgi:hypothetical protein